jgi:CheY-like chemotaxis protein/HPt (histidine-containing phosphotransfer) domain-containing protein
LQSEQYIIEKMTIIIVSAKNNWKNDDHGHKKYPRSQKRMENINQKQIAIIATSDLDICKMIKEIFNTCHLDSLVVTDFQQLIECVQEQVFTMLIISDKFTDKKLYDQIIIIRNHSRNKYLPVIVLCSQNQQFSDVKPILFAPIDFLTYPVNLNILTCKIHLFLTLDNQQKALKEESQKASLALAAKKAFLASISYDIRFPINSIIGLSDLLIGDQLTPEQTKYILSIRRSGEMLLALFNSKIDYANIQAGSLEIETKVFEPITTVQRIAAMLSSFLHSKRTELVLKIDPALPRVLLGDSARFEQILFNMLFVCIQQTINNSITLHIRVHSKQDDKIKLYISIEDDSLELNEAQSISIKNNSITDVNNIHIGLFVTRHIVQAMDGNIGFSVNNQNHTEFWCTACFLKTSPVSDIKCVKPDNMETFAYASLNPEDIRILLVDDSPINQIVEKKLLGKLGFTQIDIDENGEEAVNILTQKDYDLVLMDIFMPVMNGLDASKLIRCQNTIRNPNIPILALTAQDITHLKSDFAEYGINSYLSKPLVIEKIASSIKNLFPSLRFQLSDVESENPDQPDEFPKKNEPKKMLEFDKKLLLERLDGDEAIYQELIEGFLADIPVQINKIEKSLDFDDLTVAGQLAHTLKGAFSNVGAHLLQNIAKDLENDILDMDIKKIKQGIQLLKDSLNNIKKYI